MFPLLSRNKSSVTQNAQNDAVSINTEAKIPTLNINLAFPTLGTIVYNILDNRLYYGNGSRWILIGLGNEVYPIFPGDTVPIPPDFIICGAGSAGCALAERLVVAGKRVFMLELGNDQATNPLVTQPFAVSPFRTPSGPVNVNAFNVLFDPAITHFNGAPVGPGSGYNLYPLWTGHGIGGGGLHWLLAYVTPAQNLIDGPLLPSMIPANNLSTASFLDAGGANWSYTNVSAAVRAIENFQLITGFGSSITGISENIAERGTTGPFTCLQTQAPFPVQTTTSANGLVTDAVIPVVSNAGFPAAGTIAILTLTNEYQTVDYTGLGVNTITGCTTAGAGGFGVGSLVYLGPFTGTNTIGGPFGPPGMSFLIQASFSNAAPLIPGGAAANLVNDYNCNTSFADGQIQLNCTSQIQNGVNNTFTRQNSASSYINGITVASADGRIGNSPTRKLIIWTQCTVINADRDINIAPSYRASGVRFLKGNNLQVIKGKNIISSLGAACSPRFWQLSGIGPTALLTSKGIPTQVDSPLIGQNLTTQFGPSITVKTTNEYFANLVFPGFSFNQYNAVPRRWQMLTAGYGGSYGFFGSPPYTTPLPPAPQDYYASVFTFIETPRSRGYSNTLQQQYVG
ncbi:MAG TPA: GMC family oxidoreductase N-terminal domain-containing protein, partial [Saprospiraceae bacterium]|nr:GMC family oxidoreductase N-terminal domain-containing protein [Saprospiraceae bacterium]